MKAINKITAILMALMVSVCMSASAQRDGGRPDNNKRHEVRHSRDNNRGHVHNRSGVRDSRGDVRNQKDRKPMPQHHGYSHHHKPAPKHPMHYHKPAPVLKHHHKPAPRCHAHHKPVYHRHIHRNARPFYINNVCYYHHNGVYYRPHPTFGYEVVTIPVNTYVAALPFHCETVFVNNVAYYHGEGMWFSPYSGGYMVVEKPAVVVEAPAPTTVIVEAPAPAVVVKTPKPHFSFNASASIGF